jgi:hypothetical protein
MRTLTKARRCYRTARAPLLASLYRTPDDLHKSMLPVLPNSPEDEADLRPSQIRAVLLGLVKGEFNIFHSRNARCTMLLIFAIWNTYAYSPPSADIDKELQTSLLTKLEVEFARWIGSGFCHQTLATQ